MPLNEKTLRKLREKAGMTQAELADRAGLTPNYVATIERGERKPGLPAIERLAKALGTTAARLID